MNTDQIEILVDDDFLDLAEMYLDSKKKDITLYKDALANKDYKAIKDASHKMKGTGASYGFEYLTELGKKMEDASLAEDHPTIVDLVNDFESHLSKITIKVK